MKVSIIGGGGRVGSNAAFALQCAGIVSISLELALINMMSTSACFVISRI